MDVFIDRITIVGTMIKNELMNFINDPLSLFPEATPAQAPYSHNFDLGYAFMQLSSSKQGSNFRLDFNPSNMSNAQKCYLKDVLAMVKHKTLTRLDTAIDIKGINLNDYTVIDLVGRKFNTWHSGDGCLETLYLGAPSSELRLRFYDKAKELKLEEEVLYWRFESQARYSFAENFKTINPFEKISLVPKNADLKHIEKIQDRIIINHLLHFPNDLCFFPDRTRRRYKKRLADLSESASVNLSNIYNEHLHNIITQVDEFLY